MPTRSSPAPAPTWPASYYALINEPGSGRYGDVLAVCTIHREQHIRYVCPDGTAWCQSLPPHDGRHYVRESRRQGAPPARQPAPPVRVELVNADDLGLLIDGRVLETLRRERDEREDRQDQIAARSAVTSPTSVPEPTSRAPGRRIVDLGEDEP